MPNHDTPSDAQMTHATHGGAPAAQAPQQHRSLFDIPAPLKRIFDRFPLVTYDENQRPLRAPQDSAEQVLHVFTTAEDAKHGRPSFNPGCLKWQVWIRRGATGWENTDVGALGIPTFLRSFLQDSIFKQPCFAIRQPAVPHTRLDRLETSRCCSQQQATEVCQEHITGKDGGA